MDLTGAALRAAAARPRVLVASLPGGTTARLETERLARLRDWPLAATAAQADVLLLTGPDCPRLQAPVDRLWRDMAAPRVRVHAPDAVAVEAALDAAQARLGSLDHQRRQARASPGTGDNGPAADSHDERGGMGMPGGLPMAETGEDRDGLSLDRLHVPLGPLLADWPAGLTVRLTLQGDVVQQADVEDVVVATGLSTPPFWAQPWVRAARGEPVTRGEAARRRTAAHLDSLVRLLSTAGWPAEAVAAGRLRDDLLGGAPATAVASRLGRLARRVGRSRTLAWLTRGLGPLSAETARQAGVSGPAARAGGDVTDRYRQWLADIRRDIARLGETAPLRPGAEESPRGWWRDDVPPSAALIRLLPDLLAGSELAAARVVVASLDPDMDEVTFVRREVGDRG